MIPDLFPYQKIKDNALRKENLFLAEGRFLVTRLIESNYEVLSILCEDSLYDEFYSLSGNRFPVYSLPVRKISEIAGFSFHKGVLACGKRPEMKTSSFLFNQERKNKDPGLLVLCPHIDNQENLGALFRLAAGFGASALIIGNKGADPFGRKTLRASMGGIFNIPWFLLDDDRPEECAARCWDAEYTIIGAMSEDHGTSLYSFRFPAKTALVFGNEFSGLGIWEKFCRILLTIPMKKGFDSFNVAASAAIFLYEYKRNNPFGVN